MRKILISSAIILSLAGASGAALAGTKAATKAQSAAAASTTSSKEADCAKQWKAEKKHTQTHKAFMAACTKA